MSSAGCKEDVLQHVTQLWSMLDELSTSDPAAYRKLIHTQLEEGAGFSSPPELDSCLCADILEPNKGLLYLNICSWKRVPAPQDPSKPLPLCSGKLETGTSESPGLYTVLDVALNPAVLETDKKDKSDLYTLALTFAQQQHGLRLSQQYTVITCSPQSSPDDLNRRLGFQQWLTNTSSQPDTASQTPASLLQQIASLRSEQQDDEPAAQIICRPAENKKKDLIQVISSTFVQPQKPRHRLEVKTDKAGVPRSVELTVELPKVHSMSDCQLRISKEDVLLEVEDVCYLLLDFPVAVNEDTASAVFNKKKRQLAVKVDVL
ncbi:PIH1 domain-containing protein 2 [Hippoglossus hippoglossus]|uniref:PIH1 domain-containing protein 2 n=1 Tax=Hippoglossus hippoglossus TaxID=8267 RepID=UPI00148D1743|nr:PIH1 domain-containing protein 2 [Hippoglossus hippoglossus]